MEIIVQFVLLAVGFFMLVKGADWFVEGAAGIAEKIRDSAACSRSYDCCNGKQVHRRLQSVLRQQ